MEFRRCLNHSPFGNSIRTECIPIPRNTKRYCLDLSVHGHTFQKRRIINETNHRHKDKVPKKRIFKQPSSHSKLLTVGNKDYCNLYWNKIPDLQRSLNLKYFLFCIRYRILELS